MSIIWICCIFRSFLCACINVNKWFKIGWKCETDCDAHFVCQYLTMHGSQVTSHQQFIRNKCQDAPIVAFFLSLFNGTYHSELIENCKGNGCISFLLLIFFVLSCSVYLHSFICTLMWYVWGSHAIKALQKRPAQG